MKYFLIVGEASGDLHASHVMREIRDLDARAEFCFYGGDLMSEVGGVRLSHYRDMAYMGFVPVLLHLPAILSHMSACKKAIRRWKPDALILVDYPGFNLNIARYVHRHALCPVYYYISPKIWAWKEGRIHRIRRDVDHLFSILPFEVEFFENKHHYPITYVGNPTLDEVAAYTAAHGGTRRRDDLIALLPGSRKQEIKDNLPIMLRAADSLRKERCCAISIAPAPAIEKSFYERLILASGMDRHSVTLHEGDTFALLREAAAALVTSGTATLEAALLGAPQVVCYYIPLGPLVKIFRRMFLKVKYISLVNLILGEEAVRELVGGDMNATLLERELRAVMPDGEKRLYVEERYRILKALLGEPGAPRRAAEDLTKRLKEAKGKGQ